MAEVRWDAYPRVARVPSARAWLHLQANRQLSPRTVDVYGRALDDLLAFCARSPAGPIDVETAGRADLGCYVNDLATRPNRYGQRLSPVHSGLGMADQTIQVRLTAARLYYDHLIETGVRRDNPIGRGTYTPRAGYGGRHPSTRAHDCALVRHTHRRDPWIPRDDQFAALLGALGQGSRRDQALVLLAYDGALRREELVLLELADIDWPYREVTIRPETAKNGAGRVVLFSAPTARRLRAYLDERRLLHPETGRLFLSLSPRNRGAGLDPGMVNKIVRHLAVRADVPQLHPHTLRHLRLTHLAREGVPEHVIAEYAGHRSLETTKLYIHMGGRDITAAVARRMEGMERWMATCLPELGA